MWTPYFCSIWPCPYSEIQWYIPHNRLKRLDFSFGHPVFSLLMVHSKGESLSILILSSGMKSTSKFPFPSIFENLLFWFTLMLCGDMITYSQRLKDRGGGLWNIICQNSWKTKKFFASFSTLFSDFSWTWKSISQQKLVNQ